MHFNALLMQNVWIGVCIYVAEAYLNVPLPKLWTCLTLNFQSTTWREKERESKDAVRAQGFKLLIFFRLK